MIEPRPRFARVAARFGPTPASARGRALEPQVARPTRTSGSRERRDLLERFAHRADSAASAPRRRLRETAPRARGQRARRSAPPGRSRASSQAARLAGPISTDRPRGCANALAMRAKPSARREPRAACAGSRATEWPVPEVRRHSSRPAASLDSQLERRLVLTVRPPACRADLGANQNAAAWISWKRRHLTPIDFADALARGSPLRRRARLRPASGVSTRDAPLAARRCGVHPENESTHRATSARWLHGRALSVVTRCRRERSPAHRRLGDADPAPPYCHGDGALDQVDLRHDLVRLLHRPTSRRAHAASPPCRVVATTSKPSIDEAPDRLDDARSCSLARTETSTVPPSKAAGCPPRSVPSA